MLQNYNKILKKCTVFCYTRIKPRSRPPQKKSAYFTHPDFSAAKIEKKVCKVREQIRYIRNNTIKGMPEAKELNPESNYTRTVIML